MTFQRLSVLPMLLCSFFAPNLLAQPITFTAGDLIFFQQKGTVYQQWLDKTGLGHAIHVTKVRLKKDSTELELLLHLNSTNLDTAIALWNRAKDDYTLRSGQLLEEKLFQTFTAFMEIPPAQGNVQVYVLDEDGAYIPCFYVGIWEEDGNIRTESKMRDCREKQIDINLKPLPLRKTVKGKSTEVPRKLSSAQVFDSIEAFLKKKYTRTDCYDRRPELLVELRTESTLRISVSDLCRVVLTDEQKSLWCRAVELLGMACNDIRRERLEFEFTYLSGSNSLGGRLVGKFGSGVYRPRKSGYLDMEPDFNDYLDNYHLKFQQELKTYLEKQ
ncbi:MAG: hypothetical protein IT260_19455 [Saprospiraceae bacterium]|nr:hypothetical protein [Saprospiraceae bacterium]